MSSYLKWQSGSSQSGSSFCCFSSCSPNLRWFSNAPVLYTKHTSPHPAAKCFYFFILPRKTSCPTALWILSQHFMTSSSISSFVKPLVHSSPSLKNDLLSYCFPTDSYKRFLLQLLAHISVLLQPPLDRNEPEGRKYVPFSLHKLNLSAHNSPSSLRKD